MPKLVNLGSLIRSPAIGGGGRMMLSARSKLAGTVVPFTKSEAIANVELDVAGQRPVASITVEEVEDLGLQAGAEVLAGFKAPGVMIATT